MGKCLIPVAFAYRSGRDVVVASCVGASDDLDGESCTVCLKRFRPKRGFNLDAYIGMAIADFGWGVGFAMKGGLLV